MEPLFESEYAEAMDDWREAADEVRIARRKLAELEHAVEVARQRALDAAMTKAQR